MKGNIAKFGPPCTPSETTPCTNHVQNAIPLFTVRRTRHATLLTS